MTSQRPGSPTRRKPWFVPNRSGPGWHPGSWKGWLIIVAAVAMIAALVVLVRTGLL